MVDRQATPSYPPPFRAATHGLGVLGKEPRPQAAEFITASDQSGAGVRARQCGQCRRDRHPGADQQPKMERTEAGLGVAGDRAYRVERGVDGGQQRDPDSAADLPLCVEDRGRDAGPFRADGGEARGLAGGRRHASASMPAATEGYREQARQTPCFPLSPRSVTLF
jgi:hypothetical protein